MKFDDAKLAQVSHKVRKRDNYKCKVCGSSKNPEHHHIFAKSKYPKLAYFVWNGITLCDLHHREGIFSIHSLLGVAPNIILSIFWFLFMWLFYKMAKYPLLLIIILGTVIIWR